MASSSSSNFSAALETWRGINLSELQKKLDGQVAQLERAIATANNALRRAQLLPLPAFARASLPPIHPVWQTKEEMTSHFQTKMTLARYRKVTKLLNELNDYHRIANTAGVNDLANKIYAIVSLFESSKKDAFLARGKRKPVVLDVYGRSYTVGKRKTSSARVWMIPVQESSSASSESELKAPLPMTTILVNNIPLNEYFPLPADRERITRPLKVAGILGKYNVFSIVRGGGTTGQSGALAHGIAKGVVAHEPDLETLFRRGTLVLIFLFRPTANLRFLSVAKLTRRDPRMVERKKTGLAKARKRVRTPHPPLRSFLLTPNPLPAVHLGQAVVVSFSFSIEAATSQYLVVIMILSITCL